MLYMLSIQDIKDFLKALLTCFVCGSSCVMGNKEEEEERDRETWKNSSLRMVFGRRDDTMKISKY